MSAIPEDFIKKTTQLSDDVTRPFPNSRKIYVEGSRPDIRVPMREIEQADTAASFGAEKNPPITVYDTSGPYYRSRGQYRPAGRTAGCARCWITSAHDTELLDGPSSAFGQQRQHDPELAHLRFRAHPHAAPCAGRQQCDANALCTPGHHHPGDGVRRHPREPALEQLRTAAC